MANCTWKKNDHITIIESIANGLSKDDRLYNYLELGVEVGSLFNLIAPFVKEKAVAVDISTIPYEHIKHHQNLEWYNCSSSEYFKKEPKRIFDLIFIDADHHFEEVIKDFNNAITRISHGGLILLHDVYPPNKEFMKDEYCSTAYKTMDYIKENYSQCEVLTLPVFFGIGIVRVNNKQQLTWKESFVDLTKMSGIRGREDFQMGWQEYFGNLFQNLDILDIGAGLGNSKQRLSKNGNRVTTQDLGPELNVDIKEPINNIPSNSYDVVTTFDVIEHVKEDVEFLNNLIRISRKYVVITTPNYNISKAQNQFHCREYTPKQLIRFARGYSARFFSGDPNGFNIKEKEISEMMQHQDPHQALILIKPEKHWYDESIQCRKGLSILLPTIGKPTIINTLNSIMKQPWQDDDELIIACDGNGEKIHELVDPIIKAFAKRKIIFIEYKTSHNDWGHTPRNLIMPSLKGEYCLHIDDDDIFTDNAFKNIRNDIQSKAFVYFYKMYLPDGDLRLWKTKEIKYANLGTPCIVHRLDNSSYCKFESRFGGDFEFIKNTAELNDDSVEWKDSFIAIIKPELGKTYDF